MNWGELEAALRAGVPGGVTALYGEVAAETPIDAIAYDSRRAAASAVFVCISGMSTDGHAFAKDAYARGCRLFVTESEIVPLHGAAVYRVSDTRAALAVLSAAFYRRADRELLLVGVTGTKGKTTVASMAAQLLTATGVETGYIGSNGISYRDVRKATANTTPESLDLHETFRQMADAGVRCVVMEVSSQALYLRRVFGLTFRIAVFTNLAPDHIGPREHPTFEHYRECKASLFTDYGAQTVVCNADDPATGAMLENCPARRRLCCSLEDRRADYYASGLVRAASPAAPGVRFRVFALGEDAGAHITMPGTFNVQNALEALAVTREVHRLTGGDTAVPPLTRLTEALAPLRVAGRFESVPLFDDRAFIIDYAHNGYSLSSVLQVLAAYKPHRLITLLGSVGGRTYNRRTELGAAADEYTDLLIITSDNPDFEDPAVIMEEISRAAPRCEKVLIADRAEAIRYAVRVSAPGDIVLLAGKGHEDYQLIRGEKLPFSERAVLFDAAREMTATRA